MPGSREKYRELFKKVLDELIGENPVVDELLKPMRVYINDIERFSSPLIFISKFKSFMTTRDEQLIEEFLKKHQLHEGVSLKELQDAIDGILNQVIGLLQTSSQAQEQKSQRMQAIIEKVRDAKTLNNLRKLSDIMLEAGEELISESSSLQLVSGQLGNELLSCKKQIQGLEEKLKVTRVEADTDHLTGLFNRRMFDIDLGLCLSEASEKRPLSLMFLDLDYFKKINDRWGHGVGDDVLVNFGSLLKESLREFDRTYRLGGDEFAVIFKKCSLKKATQVGERLRIFVAEHPYKVEKITFQLSLSAGVAQWKPGESTQTFSNRVDQLLYHAKKTGRNRLMTTMEPIATQDRTV